MSLKEKALEYHRKPQYCPWCIDVVPKLPRHCETDHAEIKRIRKIICKGNKMNKEEKRKYRREQYRIINLKGQGRYNKRIRHSEDLDSLVLARESSDVDAAACIECPGCRGSFADIKRHKCPVRSKKTHEPTETPEKSADPANIRKKAKHHTITVSLKDDYTNLADLFVGMLEDDILSIVKKDELIMEFARQEMKLVADENADPTEVHAIDRLTDDNRKATLRADVRRLGKYVKTFNEVVPSQGGELTLLDTFHTDQLDHVHKVIRMCTAGYRNTFQSKKFNTLLRKVSKFARLRFDSSIEEQLLDFEFQIVSHHTRKARMIKEIEDPSEPLDTGEMEVLRLGCDKQIEAFGTTHTAAFTYPMYIQYCMYVIVRILLYNLKRSGEVAAMTEQQFKNRTSGSEVDLSQYPEIGEEERKQIEERQIVMLKGKSAHHQAVFAVLTRETYTAILKLRYLKFNCLGLNEKDRSQLEKNDFVFAIKGDKMWHVEGHKAFQSVREELGVSDITAGKIRKLIGTGAALETDGIRRKLLSSILGHDTATHDRIYEEHMKSKEAQFVHVPQMLDQVAKKGGHLHHFNASSSTSADQAVASGSTAVASPSAGIAIASAAVASTSAGEADSEGYKKPKRITWTSQMLKILHEEFKSVFEANAPITAKKSEKVQKVLEGNGYMGLSVGAVRSQAQREKKKTFEG